MKKILIISFSTIHSDPRVMRQVRLLESSYRVTVAGFGKKPDASVDFVELPTPPSNFFEKIWRASKLLFRRFESYYWNLPRVIHGKNVFSSQKFDLIIANDLSALPLALEISQGASVLLDAHEYSPREFEENWLWRLLFARHYHYICKNHLPKCSAMTTVCQGISDEYFKNYGVRSEVLYNAPTRQDLTPSPVVANSVRLVHHGLALRSRHLEEMIEMFKHLDQRFTLDFMLVSNDQAYMDELRNKASETPRISFIPPVPMHEICSRLNDFDIGLYLLPPANFNQEHALPNKFFEFIQARLAIAIGPSPEMEFLTKKYNCGIVSETFKPEELAEKINALSLDDITKLKAAANIAANSLNYESGSVALLERIETLLNKKTHGAPA